MILRKGVAIMGTIFFLVSAGLIITAIAEDEPLPPEVPFQPIQDIDIQINPASKARIKFESDTFDFGSIPRGSTVVHTFKFRNAGEDTLHITSVRPTCGCTTAPLSSDRIAPGEEATIKAYFNSQKFNGRVTKQIYVNSDDPINPYLKVSFKATINDPLLPISMAPLEADFGSIKSGSPSQMKITLTNSNDTPCAITLIDDSAAGFIRTTPASTTVRPHETAEIVLDLTPQSISGELKESITFDIEGGQGARFTLPWRAVITQ